MVILCLEARSYLLTQVKVMPNLVRANMYIVANTSVRKNTLNLLVLQLWRKYVCKYMCILYVRGRCIVNISVKLINIYTHCTSGLRLQ